VKCLSLVSVNKQGNYCLLVICFVHIYVTFSHDIAVLCKYHQCWLLTANMCKCSHSNACNRKMFWMCVAIFPFIFLLHSFCILLLISCCHMSPSLLQFLSLSWLAISHLPFLHSSLSLILFSADIFTFCIYSFPIFCHLPSFMWPKELSVSITAPFLSLACTIFPLY
jgi:hypothetical protein